MDKTSKKIIAIILTILVVSIPLITEFGIILPAHSKYYRTFGSHVVMAYGQATFEGVKTQIMVLWKNMNETFKEYDYNNTFNTPWYWHQNYDNSLTAQQDYFKAIILRIDAYIEQYNLIKTSQGSSLLQDWYAESIHNLRQEMKRMGGLDWVIHNAWLLNYAPLAYWSPYFWWPLWSVFIAIDVLFIMSIIEDKPIWGSKK